MFNFLLVIVLFFMACPNYGLGSASEQETCSNQTAFLFRVSGSEDVGTMALCTNGENTAFGYRATVDMPVCDDGLCSNVVLKIRWDLAGNYAGFDTVPGHPLTKFDHLPFSDADYIKLDEILRNRNSALRWLEKDELVDKQVQRKATTVDAVTGATPTTIKNSVVEGAVYSSYQLWHLVNGPVKDRIREHTLGIYSSETEKRMLLSPNFDTQLFALKQMTANDLERNLPVICEVIRESVPVVKAYIINKMPLPLKDEKANRDFAALFPTLDQYSKSLLMKRISSDTKIARTYLPLIELNHQEVEAGQFEPK